MTLDRAERERREGQFCNWLCNWLCKDPDIHRQVAQPHEREHLDEHQWLREAHARITELEKALHARRLRCADLEAGSAWHQGRVDQAYGDGAASAAVNVLSQTRYWQKRAEGWRKSAGILRDRLGDFLPHCFVCGRVGGTYHPATDTERCWRHR